MANLGGTFDATQVEPNAPFEVIPPGDYVVTIVSSEMRANKANTSEYLLLEMAIEEGPYKGRHLFQRLMLNHIKPDVDERAQRDLSAICRAVGVYQTSDSEDLHHKRMIVRVIVNPAGPDKHGVHREAQNEVKEAKPVGGISGVGGGSAHQGFQPSNPQQAAQTAAAPVAAPAQTASRPSTPPWRKQQ